MGWFDWLRGRRGGNARRSTTATAARKGRQLRVGGGRQYLVEEPYILPKDDTEMNRLDFQHYLFRLALKGNYAAPITDPTNILDVGTGTGRWAMEMAGLFPDANVIGLDLLPPPADKADAASAVADRRPDNYLYMQGNVLDGLPFQDGTFDYVHQRLLVAGLPAARWPSVVAELLRVTKPGGWVELLEAIPTHGGPAMNILHDWLVSVGVPRGVNITITYQIADFLRMAGAQNVVSRELPMPLGKWGGRSGSMMETNYFALHQSIEARLLESGTTNADEFLDVVRRARREIDGGRYIWPYFLAYGQRPFA